MKDELDLYELADGAANFMRGLLMDPALPDHIKEAVICKTDDMGNELGDHLMRLEGEMEREEPMEG